MVRIAEYWDMWAARLEVEIAKAFRQGDQKSWTSLKQARERALAMAEEIRNQPKPSLAYVPPTVTQGFLTATHW